MDDNTVVFPGNIMYSWLPSVRPFVAAALVISMGITSPCVCLPTGGAAQSHCSKAAPRVKECPCCSQDGGACGAACCGKDRASRDERVAPVQRPASPVDLVAEYFARVALVDLGSSHGGDAGVDSQAANLCLTGLTLRARHVCLQV